MKNFTNYFKKEKWVEGLLFFGLAFIIFFPSHAESIRNVSQSIQQVQTLDPSLQFAMIGDSRDGEKVYMQLIKNILKRKPNFLIHLGDMISSPKEKEWQAFFKNSKMIEVPFFPVAGNHDVGTSAPGEEMYRSQFSLPKGKTYYAFQSGDVLFAILDSEKGKGRIFKEQWSWLEGLLSSSKNEFKLVFLHRPLFPPVDSLKTWRAMDKYSHERDSLHQLFLRTKVKAVFAGDDHRYDRNERDGILYVISGGGGAPLASFKERGGYFHYLWVSVEKGRMEGEAVDVENQVQDRFVIK